MIALSCLLHTNVLPSCCVSSVFFSGRWITAFFFAVIFRSSSAARPEDSPDAEVHEKYIELMCKYQPDLVHSYLRNTENYRLEETLAVCSSRYRLGLHQRRFFPHATKPGRYYFGFTHLSLKGKSNPVRKCPGYITSYGKISLNVNLAIVGVHRVQF